MAEEQTIGGGGGLPAAGEHTAAAHGLAAAGERAGAGDGDARHDGAQHGVVLHQIGVHRTLHREGARPSSSPAATIGPGQRRITIPVTGMTCAACSGRVQRTLSKQPGVAEAAVNLMLVNATVVYDPSQTSPEALVEAIRATGYGAELPAPERTAFEEQEERDRAQAEEFRDLARKAGVSLAAGVLAMLASMPLMAGAAHGGHAPTADPFMRWVMGWLSPLLERAVPWLYTIPAPVLTYGLLAVTLLIMAWAGRHFYTRAWAAFRHHSADMNTLIAVGT